MAATQKEIADKLGLSRTTISKILNRDPRYYANPKTKERVFATAEAMGYDFSSIRRPYKRGNVRAAVGAKCDLTILLNTGEIFDKGTAEVINISSGGALLGEIATARMVLPLESFKLLLRLSGIEELEDVVGECEIVRVSHTGSGGPHLGTCFTSTTPDDARRIDDFVKAVLGIANRASPGGGES